MTDIIAEIGQAHDGSLGILHSYIDAVSTTGVSAIKFQTHLADAESSQFEPFRVNFSYEDKTRYDYWKRMELSFDQWREIKAHCDDVDLKFISSPFSNAAVDLLENLGPHAYKVGSGEVSNFLLLEKLSRTQRPIILSSGMSSLKELHRSVEFLTSRNVDLTVLQCTTSYPTTAREVGLNVLKDLQDSIDCPVGFSDHSGDIFAGLAACALGAKVLEVHVVFDKRCFGPDSTSSLTIDELSKLVEGVRFINESQNNPVSKSDTSKYADLKAMFGKSLAVNKRLPKGHVITFDDLESKKPQGHGICSSRFDSVIGARLLLEKSPWDFLLDEDLFCD